MKKLMLSALGAVLALTACGASDQTVPASESGLTTVRTPDEVPRGRGFELRLRGVNAGAYDTVLVPIHSLEVSAGSEPLPVRLVARTVDVTAAEHAHLVGSFFVPEGVSQVKVTLTFDDAGGWEQGGLAGVLDTRVAPLRFEAPVDSLSQRGRAVVLLDVDKSLLPVSETERLLLPGLQVNY